MVKVRARGRPDLIRSSESRGDTRDVSDSTLAGSMAAAAVRLLCTALFCVHCQPGSLRRLQRPL